jgi:hypothetical protein
VTAAGSDRSCAEAGFSLPELLVATALLVSVVGGVFAMLDPAQGTYRAQPEATDMQQRLRVVVEALQRDLVMAGAGPYQGTPNGPLVYWFAPIQPHAAGADGEAMPGGPSSRAITIAYVPATAAQATTVGELPPGGSEVEVAAQPGCPEGDPLCGFSEGTRVLIVGPSGAYGVFTVTGAQGTRLQVQRRNGPGAESYPGGSRITEVSSHSYYLDEGVYRLHRYDGHLSDLPIADQVVTLRFEYFGDPSPPRLHRPVTDAAGPWTTYGPRPPPAGVDEPGDDWGPGENCVFRVVDGEHAPRLPDLPGPASGLVSLPIGLFADGPWCPGASNGAGVDLPDRFDADLLRVRKVRVTVRLQVATESLRGTNPPGTVLFANPGTSRSGHAFVPDREIRFEVTPRNMAVGR